MMGEGPPVDPSQLSSSVPGRNVRSDTPAGKTGSGRARPARARRICHSARTLVKPGRPRESGGRGQVAVRPQSHAVAVRAGEQRGDERAAVPPPPVRRMDDELAAHVAASASAPWASSAGVFGGASRCA